MFIHNEDPRFAYLPPMKTASSTITAVLLQLFKGLVQEGTKHQIVRLMDMQSYYVFASARCPFSWAVSMRRHIGYKEPSPEWTGGVWEAKRQAIHMTLPECLRDDFVFEYLFEPISKQLAGVSLDYLIRFEHLEEDLRNLPVIRGLDFGLPHLRKRSYDVPWWQLYVEYPELEELVLRRFRQDFETFCYSQNLSDYLPQEVIA